MATGSVNPVMVAGAGPDPPRTMEELERDRAQMEAAAAAGLPMSGAPSEVEVEMSPMEKLQEQIKEMEKKMVGSEKLQKQVEQRNAMIEKMIDDKDNKEVKTKQETNDAVRGFDTKTVKRPEAWNGKKEDFLMWNLTLQAFMGTFDRQWKGILQAVQKHKHEVKLDEEELDKILKDKEVKVNEDTKDYMRETLFMTLIQYTNDDIRARICSEGEQKAFALYKWICWKGEDLDLTQIGELRSQVLNPEKAANVSDVEKKAAKFKEDATRLMKIRPNAVQVEDWKQPFWSILPDVIQEHLISKDQTPEDDVTFDRMEKTVEEFLKKWRQKNGSRGGKSVNAVVEQPADEKETKIKRIKLAVVRLLWGLRYYEGAEQCG